MDKKPRLVVFCSLYPSRIRPNAGIFIRERMGRVAQHCPLVVVSPVPWFPLQSLIRFFKPDYRPQPDSYESQNGTHVYFPRFFSVPGTCRSLDGFFMAVGSFLIFSKLKKEFGFNLIDGHFAYPDGYAATLLGLWFKVPVTITLRGTEVPLAKEPARCKLMLKALKRSGRVFSVSESLRSHMVALGADPDKIQVVGNGVDTRKFFPLDKTEARKKLDIHNQAQVLISVGGLVDRKGFHRVIDILPGLLEKHPRLLYLIVGGASPEGNIRERLEQQVCSLGLTSHVRFLGSMDSNDLHVPLSSADVFVLATSNEGWANVFLEAMACGLPVVTTDVGGNREVVCDDYLGFIVPFGSSNVLSAAVDAALIKKWDCQKILDYAAGNGWDRRVTVLLSEFNRLVNR
jgi:glycosyltransferase involved in cell wall biosynthesis